MKNDKKHGSIRVVLDTNVYISVFTTPDRPLFAVWTAAVRRSYRLLTSPAIIRELSRILRKRFGWEDERVLGHAKLVAHVSTLVIPTEIPQVIAEDPADNHILACAATGKADLIVTGDKDLLRLKEYQGIAIIRPADFLRILNGL